MQVLETLSRVSFAAAAVARFMQTTHLHNNEKKIIFWTLIDIFELKVTGFYDLQ